jgi:hypothetical protein
MEERESGAWTGFAIFAGTMLLILGAINAFQGLIALLDDQSVAMHEGNLVIVDKTTWGWVVLIFGILIAAAGGCLLLGQPWARIAAIVLVGVHLVSQVASLGAYPVWSLLMIALDVVVLFALTTHWGDVRSRLEKLNEEEWQERENVDTGARIAPTIT